MKSILLGLLFLATSLQARVVEEITVETGYHTKESFVLKQYQTDKAQGYALIKVIGDNTARVQRLNAKEYKKRQLVTLKLIQSMKKYEVSPVNTCFEKVRIQQALGRKPASETVYCLDQAPSALKKKVVAFLRMN